MREILEWYRGSSTKTNRSIAGCIQNASNWDPRAILPRIGVVLLSCDVLLCSRREPGAFEDETALLLEKDVRREETLAPRGLVASPGRRTFFLLRYFLSPVPFADRCILKWDNSYSRLRGKRLRFVMESVTVRTMLAAIEAAGAADHKRRAIRSVAAQTILDSSPDQVHITVTAVSITDGAGSAVDGDAESTNDGCSGKSAESRSDGGSAGTYRFGRIRRVAAALLRDLGTLVDAQDTGASSTGRPVVIANKGDGGNGDEGGCGDADEAASVRRGAHDAKPRAEACGADYSKADATGVGKLVERFEQLEDEVASCSARRAQSEAQAKVLLATLQKSNTKVER